MGLEIAPEIKMARLLHKKHSLKIPVDLNKLVSNYAQLIFKAIPIDGVDGVCLNLKTPKKDTKIIVNNSSSLNRQRFTLAHELGHIIIPWHLGTIVDEIDDTRSTNGLNTQYWTNETEANRFASELLMPFDWLYSKFLKTDSWDDLISLTSTKCVVSDEAARIRIKRFSNELIDYELPPTKISAEYSRLLELEKVQESLVEQTPIHPLVIAQRMTRVLKGKIAFCVEENNIVIGSGSTSGTHAFYQGEGADFVKQPYPYFKRYSTFDFRGLVTHWWDLDVIFDVKEDPRSWRDILDIIANDLAGEVEAAKFKRSINASLSGIYGNWKVKYPEKGVDEFIDEVMPRYNNAHEMHILQHPDFGKFVRKRSFALFGIAD